MELGVRDDDGQPGVLGEEPGLWDQPVGGVLRLVDHRAGQQPVHDLDGDEVEHDRAQDLVDVEIGLEGSRDRTPDGAAGRTGEEHERDEHDAGQVGQRECGRRARQAAHGKLALATDVEDVGAERHADADGDEKKRGGLHGRGTESLAAVEGADDHGVVAGDRVGAEASIMTAPSSSASDEGRGQSEPAQQESPPVLPSIGQPRRKSTHGSSLRWTCHGTARTRAAGTLWLHSFSVRKVRFGGLRPKVPFYGNIPAR